MPQNSVTRAEARRNGDFPSERRHCPRKPVPEVVVAVELSDADDGASGAVSDTGGGLAWAGSAIDISPEGLGLTLPDDIPVGSEVLLTFRLDAETAFARVPSVVIHKQPGFGLGAVRFRSWSRGDRLALGAYLG